MKAGRAGLRGSPVSVAVTTKQTREIQARARELLLGSKVEEVWVHGDSIYITVEGGATLALHYQGGLREIQ